jgi:hypothetical protein
VTLGHDREDRQGHQGQQQRPDGEVAGVEHGDDGDRDEVVDHGEGEQEDPQGAREVRADDGQDGHGEGDVRRGRDRPAPQRLRVAEVHERVEDGGDRHPSRCRCDGHHGPAELAQVPGHELAFEFQSHEEEEDRQQAVGRPRPEAQLQVPGGVPDPQVA